MPAKIIFSTETIEDIKNQYTSGIGSTTIAKNLKIGRHQIVRVIKDEGLLRNRHISNEFYSNFWLENNMWCGYWICQQCNDKIKFSVNNKTLLNRSIKRKKICRKCYSKNNGFSVRIQEIINKPFDFYLPDYNLLIEFNGDYWHCNPKLYSENYFNKKSKKFAKDIWMKDKNKIDFAKNKGYNCEVIWESDYKNNKNLVLEIIKKYEKN